MAGLRLPDEQQQHHQVNHQGRPAAARFTEVGPEGVAAATVVDAPAEVSGEGHVEEQHLEEGRDGDCCIKVHAREGGGGRPLRQDGRLPHLNDPDNIGEAALQVVSIDEDAKGKAGAFVAVYQLADEPRTCEETSNIQMEATVSPEAGLSSRLT